MTLTEVIRDLQSSKLNQDKLIQATIKLGDLGYKYKTEQFPTLENTDKFKYSPTNMPSNLAESLL